MTYQIYEFFPGFKVVRHPILNKYVSGGFTNDIYKSKEIPEEVMNAVFEVDDFGNYLISKNFNIPDTSPPKDNQVALIARDIGNYCILAVANAQKDDSDRIFIGYRFFWLLKSESIDGVGTLILFWRKEKCPSFNISLISAKQTLSPYICEQIYTKKIFEDHYSQKLADFSSKLNTIPAIFESNKDGRQLTPEELHYLAIKATSIHQRPISWAWNVRHLSHPQNFSVIYCADGDALQKFSRLSKSSPQLPPKTSDPTSNLSSNSPPLPATNTQPQAPTSYPDNDRDIRSCLLQVARNPSSAQIKQLLNYYQTHGQNLYDYREKTIITRFKNDQHTPNQQDIIYITLIAILAPDKDTNLISHLEALDKNYIKHSIEFLDKLKAIISSNYKEHPAQATISQGITKLSAKLSHGIRQQENFLTDFLPFWKQVLVINRASKSNNTNQKKDFLPLSIFGILIVAFIIVLFNYINSLVAQKAEFVTPGLRNGFLSSVSSRDFLLDQGLDQVIISYPNLRDEQQKKETKDYIIKELNKLINLESKSNQKPESYSSIKNLFVPPININFSKDKPFKSNITAHREIVQTALKVTGFYSENSTLKNQWNNDDIKALKKFQQQYKYNLKVDGIPDNLIVDGIPGSNTWKKLSENFIDKQVKLAAHYLQQSFTIHKRDDEIYQDIKELKECKSKGSQDFIDCVNKKIEEKQFQKLPQL